MEMQELINALVVPRETEEEIKFYSLPDEVQRTLIGLNIKLVVFRMEGKDTEAAETYELLKQLKVKYLGD